MINKVNINNNRMEGFTSFKNLIAVFLLILIIIQVFKPSLPYLEYGLYRDYIVANFCKEKSKPVNHCQGHCFLQDRLKEAASQQENEEKLPVTDQRDFYFIKQFTLSIHPFTFRKDIKFDFYSDLYTLNILYPIFHPPA